MSYDEHTPVYALPKPSDITKEESEALTYAFITFLKGKIKYE